MHKKLAPLTPDFYPAAKATSEEITKLRDDLEAKVIRLKLVEKELAQVKKDKKYLHEIIYRFRDVLATLGEPLVPKPTSAPAKKRSF